MGAGPGSGGTMGEDDDGDDGEGGIEVVSRWVGEVLQKGGVDDIGVLLGAVKRPEA